MRLRFNRGRRTGDNNLEFELNIVPIIDCFTILITFLLSSGAFIAIGNLSVSVSGGEGSVSEAKPAPVQISVYLDDLRNIRLDVTGAITKKIEFKAIEGKRDLVGLKNQLTATQADWPDQKSVTLESSSELPYEELILVMEAIKHSHEDVLLGGF